MISFIHLSLSFEKEQISFGLYRCTTGCDDLIEQKQWRKNVALAKGVELNASSN